MSLPARVAGVLLDVDGTLIDSNTAHARAWADAFAEGGIDAPSVEEIRRLIGMGGDKLLPQAVGLTEDSSDGKHLSRRRSEIFVERYLPRLGPTRGAGRLVRELQARGVRVGVATSAKPEELRELLERADVPPGLADRAASADEVDGSKPEPDVVEAALDRIAVDPSEAILVGDTPYDVEAGRRAGVAVVALRCGGWGDEDLDGAVAIHEDPADLAEHLDELVPRS